MWNKIQRIYIGEDLVRPMSVLYSSANWKIIHNIADGEIWLIPSSWTTIKIQDKDVGSTTAWTTSASYGGWYAFTSIPAAPSGYHVPTSTERQNLMDLWQQITGSNSDDLIMQHLLIPWAGFKDWSTQKDIGAWLYWSSTSYNSSTAWGTRFYPTATFMDLWKHGKSVRLWVRCFKD